MNVAFLNENTLGHTSYLPRFAEALSARPELGVKPHVIDVLPLPADLRRLGDTSVRGLRKVGLDFHTTRWRVAISRHARRQLDSLRQRVTIHAIVVNTQSAGLELGPLLREIPTLVALDATFRQLADSPWFGLNRPCRWLQPLTLHTLLRRERELFDGAARMLPWSEVAADSLRQDYGIRSDRIVLLPPSLAVLPARPKRMSADLPQLLFLGGDFVRKGGPLLLEVFRRELAGRARLHVVTQSEVPAEPGVEVHRGVKAGCPPWLARWHEADVFVFPSTLETFGIVLLEALAFEVPVVTSAAGAARSILAGGTFGRLVEPLNAHNLSAAIKATLDDPAAARAKSVAGRASFLERFELGQNTARLAELLHAVARRNG